MACSAQHDEGLSREAQVILCCCGSLVNEENESTLQGLLNKPLDWPQLVRLAVEHGVMPLVYLCLARQPIARMVPADTLVQLRLLYHANALRNHHLAAETVRLSELLASIGIDCLCFKGPALAAAAYGDVSMRRFADLDILVHDSDLAAAAGVLERDGYTAGFDCAGAAASWVFAPIEDSFVKNHALGEIDLHWRLTPRFFPNAPDEQLAWGRRVKIALDGGTVSSLCPEDHLLYLCVHGSRSGWPRLDLITDLAALVRSSPELAWDKVVSEAAQLRSSRALWLGMMLAHDFLGLEIPMAMRTDQTTKQAVAGATAMVRRRMFDQPRGRAASLKSWIAEIWTIPLQAIERSRDRIGYCADRILVPNVRDWQLVALPRPLFPVYFALRPFRLAAKFGAKALRSLIKPGSASTDGD